MWKGISAEELFIFLGLCVVSGVLRTRKEPEVNLWTTNAVYARMVFRATMVKDRFIQILHVIHFYEKLQEINGDKPTK